MQTEQRRRQVNRRCREILDLEKKNYKGLWRVRLQSPTQNIEEFGGN
jgi:hypothetical protein